MNPGRLDTPITIEYNAGTTKNDGGETVEDWQTYSTPYADLSYKSGIETTQSDQKVGVTNVDMLTWLDTGVKQSMRVKDPNDNYYDIVGVQPLDKMFMVLRCFIRDNANVN